MEVSFVVFKVYFVGRYMVGINFMGINFKNVVNSMFFCFLMSNKEQDGYSSEVIAMHRLKFTMT